MAKYILGLLLFAGISWGQIFPATANRIVRGNGVPPASSCADAGAVGKVYIRQDAAAAHATLYVCSNTASMTYAWELQAGGGSGMGCVPSGSSGHILVDDGAGSCTTTTPTISGSTITATITGNASTATALAANPADCAATRYATTIAANGDLTCAQVSLSAGVTGSLPHANIAATAVTPGSYTAANITVAADGSITAAANGSPATGCQPAGSAGQVLTDAGDGTCTSQSGVTVSSSTLTATGGFASGSSPPTVTAGTGGADAWGCGTAPSAGPGSDKAILYCDATADKLLLSLNNGSYFALPQVIARGAKALDFASTATGACATVITDTATGAASTDTIIFNANASIKAVTGYVPASTGGFSIAAFPTTNTVSFEACNWTSGTVDPGSITVNWMVIR